MCVCLCVYLSNVLSICDSTQPTTKPGRHVMLGFILQLISIKIKHFRIPSIFFFYLPPVFPFALLLRQGWNYVKLFLAVLLIKTNTFNLFTILIFSRNLHWSWKLRIYVNYSFFFCFSSLFFIFLPDYFPLSLFPLFSTLKQSVHLAVQILCIFVLNKKKYINCISYYIDFYERQFRTSLRFNCEEGWWVVWVLSGGELNESAIKRISNSNPIKLCIFFYYMIFCEKIKIKNKHKNIKLKINQKEIS